MAQIELISFAFLDRVSWTWVILAALTLGLAPFVPKPHLLEKLQMLAAGTLRRPIDWFDLVLHGLPWALLAAKAVRVLLVNAR